MEYIKGDGFKLYNTSVTLGKFDGIHLGHKELIKVVTADKKLKSVFFTFDLNPLNLFSEKEIKLINTPDERNLILGKFGIDYLIDFPFTPETADTRAEDFIKEVIYEKLGAEKVVVGSDFRFGKDREGDVSLLDKMKVKYNYSLSVIEKKKMDCETVSSTGIRNYIKEGNIRKANRFLGREYFIAGDARVLKTSGSGTVMVQKPERIKLLPADGRYMSETEIDGKIYEGITFIKRTDKEITKVETIISRFSGKTEKCYIKVNLLDSCSE